MDTLENIYVEKGQTRGGGKNCVRRQGLFEDQSSWNSKDICKVLTKPMVVDSLNYDLAEKLIRGKR